MMEQRGRCHIEQAETFFDPFHGKVSRLGAITLFAVTSEHLRDVIRRRRKTRETWPEIVTGPDSIIFNRRDAREFVQSIR